MTVVCLEERSKPERSTRKVSYSTDNKTTRYRRQHFSIAHQCMY